MVSTDETPASLEAKVKVVERDLLIDTLAGDLPTNFVNRKLPPERMRISTLLSYSNGMKEAVKEVQALESAGLDMVWVPEAYSFDAPSAMGYIAGQTKRVTIASGILPIYSRTPTLLAMTAAGIDYLSDGRCMLGLGASGPQVIEGFHGVPYDAPTHDPRNHRNLPHGVAPRKGQLRRQSLSDSVASEPAVPDSANR